MTQDIKIDLDNYASGIYFIQVYSNERKFIFKVIKD